MANKTHKRPEQVLKDAIKGIQDERPSMSLRNIASRLDITASYLSKILHGKQPLPHTLLPKVIKVLKLDTQQVALLQRSILGTIESDQIKPLTGVSVQKELGASPIADYEQLNAGHYWMLEEWYYIPILNLFSESPVSLDLPRLSDRLGLAIQIVEDAIDKLVQADLLNFNADKDLFRTQQKVRFPTTKSHPAIRQYHSEMMDKAKIELNEKTEDSDFEDRLISSVCFTGPRHQVKEAKLIMEEAMYKVANLMSEAPDGDDIFQLNIQFFPLTMD
jgi:uncharacterized protein (TIGR02147 family)